MGLSMDKHNPLQTPNLFHIFWDKIQSVTLKESFLWVVKLEFYHEKLSDPIMILSQTVPLSIKHRGSAFVLVYVTEIHKPSFGQ